MNNASRTTCQRLAKNDFRGNLSKYHPRKIGPDTFSPGSLDATRTTITELSLDGCLVND